MTFIDPPNHISPTISPLLYTTCSPDDRPIPTQKTIDDHCLQASFNHPAKNKITIFASYIKEKIGSFFSAIYIHIRSPFHAIVVNKESHSKTNNIAIDKLIINKPLNKEILFNEKHKEFLPNSEEKRAGHSLPFHSQIDGKIENPLSFHQIELNSTHEKNNNAINTTLQETHTNQSIENSSINHPIDPIQEENKKTHQTIVENWLTNHKSDFIAHAVWGTNFEKIMADKENPTIMPSESILREKGLVEFEQGSMHGQRGELKRTLLTDVELNQLEVLEEEDQEKLDTLNALKKEETITVNEFEELKNLRKKIQAYGKSHMRKANPMSREDFNIKLEEELLNKMKNENISIAFLQRTKKDLFEKEGYAQLTEVEQARFQELNAKVRLTNQQRSELHFLERNKYGLGFVIINKHHFQDAFVSNLTRFRVIEELAKKHCTDRINIPIAYDQQKGKIADKYLAHKFKKLSQKENPKIVFKLLLKARQAIFEVSKLNAEIRTLKNEIAWSYGNVAILRGKTEGILAQSNITGENLLLEPWQNNGDFFSLPLAEENTLVIGTIKELAPHKKEMDTLGIKYAFTEYLSEDQQRLFRVPQHLRQTSSS